MITALVINAEAETERLNFQLSQAQKIGLEIKRMSAVEPNSITPPAEDEFWKRWQRPLRDVEKAAVLSHYNAWIVVRDSSAPFLILEDDVLLSPSVPFFLSQLSTIRHLEHVTLETRGRKKILGSRHSDFTEIQRLWLDRTGAAAYVLWPAGAKKLIDQFLSAAAIADAVSVETPNLIRWQANPALAVQMDVATHYGFKSPITVTSSILCVERPLSRGLKFKLKRLLQQFKFLVPHLRLLWGAEKKEIFPDPEISKA